MPPRIDLRSDTVTQPCSGMREAMASANVGDDVICSDPTVEELQQTIAGMLGKEAALFMPSGTMANQVAVRVHCSPGDEFICESDCHIYRYEQGAFAQLSGLVPKLVSGERGVLRQDQLDSLISPADDHALRTRLITLENTHNRGGGTIQPIDQTHQICKWAMSRGLRSHLDGARLFNAAVALGVAATAWSDHFDSVSVCFSKGLGAPVGSAVAGTAEFVRAAKRARKLFGGGMRQSGILAAGALYALKHNIDDLRLDHEKADQLAQAASQCEGLHVPSPPETNIVVIHVDPGLSSAQQFVDELADLGVGAFAFGPQMIRLVTHRDLDAAQIAEACASLSTVTNLLNQRAVATSDG